MRTRIVIPHRGLDTGKTRLAPVLSRSMRAGLSEAMLGQVASACLDVIPEVVLVSPDARLRPTAVRLRVGFLLQDGLGLNAALEQARRAALQDGVTTLAVVSSDLPMLAAHELRQLLAGVPRSAIAGVVVAPDAAGTGTNALVLRPPDVIPFRFGVRSQAAHSREARIAGVPVCRLSLPGLARDIDTPADLDEWRRVSPHIRLCARQDAVGRF